MEDGAPTGQRKGRILEASLHNSPMCFETMELLNENLE